MSRGKREIQSHWRPNFINSSKLPDIKVIRTNFIVNFIAVTVVLICSFFAVKREYRVHSLSVAAAQMQEQIQFSEAGDNSKLSMSIEFNKAAANIIDLEKFYSPPTLAHQFLVDLSAIRPTGLVFRSIAFSESILSKGKKQAVGYRLSVTGEVEDPLELESLKSLLQNAEFLQFEMFDTVVNETLKGRNAMTGVFRYSIVVSLTPKGFEK